MKKIFISAMVAFMATLASCGLVDKAAQFGSPQMDADATYEEIAKSADGFDKKWKPFRLMVNNKGVGDMCSNEVSSALIYMIDAENNKISQKVLPELGAPTPEDKFYKDLNYDDVPPMDLSAATLTKNINDCKAMIPEGFKFLNLERYLITYDSRLKGYEGFLEINVQEVGKETIEANGKASEVYYQLKFKIAPDGTISIDEK